jgi:hypothetical protein
MAKITLNNLNNLSNENTAVTTINNNNDAIETAIENTLSRDGTTPNQMGSNLDMNFWHILNLPEPSSDTDPVRLIDLTNVSEVTNVLHTASSTSNTIGTGNKTFTVPSGLGFFPGQYLLIQDAASTSNYMIGRVVSYSGTSLVFNSIVVAGSGTFSNWTIDISGAPGPVSVVYDTVANAIGSTIPGTLSFLQMVGYTTSGDGGNGLYKRSVGMPAHMGRFQSADGAWWELASQDVTPEMFNCKGDGLTDDRANFQNCIDFVNSRGGGNIQLTPSKTYRIVLSGATSLNNKSGVNIYFRGATISLEQSGSVFGFRMNSNTRLIGPGNLFSPISTAVGGSQSIYHATISFGEPNGLEGSVASPSPLTTINNIVIDGLTITNARNTNPGEGSIIQGTGGIHDITIQNCIFPDNSGAALCIGFDWGFYGTLNSFAIHTSRTNYDAGTAYSIHPHNLIVKNNQIGNMTNTQSYAIRLSGCYNAHIVGNDIQSATFSALQQTGGDLSFEFAPTEVRLNACRNLVWENNNVHNFKAGFGITAEAFPDNVYDAATNPGNPDYPYTPIGLVDGYNVNTRIVGNKIQTSNTVNTNSGIFVGYTRGTLISDNVVGGGLFSQYGIRLQKGANHVVVENNDVGLFQVAGIFVSDGTPVPVNNIIRKNTVYRCGNSGASNGNILIDQATDTIVAENLVGTTTEDQALNGIRVGTSSTRTTVAENVVQEVKTGGTAFNLAYGNNITGIWEFKGNTYKGSQTYIAGTGIVPYRRDYSVAQGNTLITHAVNPRGLLTADITPTYGTWGAGSTCTNLDAVTGQTWQSKCTVSGTPGTWKALNTVQ